MITALALESKRFSHPDEVRKFPKGRLDLLHFGESVIGRVTLQPGWRWSKDVKPIAKTKWCEAPHFQYAISGRLHFITSDGKEFEMKAGDVMSIPPGHDAWVIGNEAFVAIDWAGMAKYAKK